MSTDKKTALFEMHKSLNAKIVPFGGWAMPVSYTSVLQEHKAVREQCGIFDVSHMGEVFVSGKNATEFLQKITINDIHRLKVGGGQYSAILNESGGMIDDLIIYKLAEDNYLICVNASNKDKDYNWIKSQSLKETGVLVEDKSDEYSQIAVQGPTSPKVMEAILPAADLPESFLTNINNINRSRHPRARLAIVVVNNSFVRVMFNTFSRLYSREVQKVAFVNSLEEARRIAIAQQETS